jgi:hypothetical protein
MNTTHPAPDDVLQRMAAPPACELCGAPKDVDYQRTTGSAEALVTRLMQLSRRSAFAPSYLFLKLVDPFVTIRKAMKVLGVNRRTLAHIIHLCEQSGLGAVVHGGAMNLHLRERNLPMRSLRESARPFAVPEIQQRMTGTVTDKTRGVQWWQHITATGAHLTHVISLATGYHLTSNAIAYKKLTPAQLDALIADLHRAEEKKETPCNG